MEVVGEGSCFQVIHRFPVEVFQFYDQIGRNVLFSCRYQDTLHFSLDVADLTVEAFRHVIDAGGQCRRLIVFPEHDFLRQIPFADFFQVLFKSEQRSGNFVRNIQNDDDCGDGEYEKRNQTCGDHGGENSYCRIFDY